MDELLEEVMEYAFAAEVGAGQFPFSEDEAALMNLEAEDTQLKEEARLQGDEPESELSWWHHAQAT